MGDAAPAWLPGAVEFLRSMRPGSVCAVVGMPQTGKSRVLKAAVASGVFPRSVVFDPYGRRDRAMHGDARAWRGTWCRAADVVACPDQLLDVSPCRVVVAPDDVAPDALGADFEAVASVLWHTGGVDLLGDEAGLYSREARELVMRLASGGAHAGMRLVLVAQSFTRLHVDARRHVSHVVAFAQGADEDLKALAPRIGKAAAAQVASLAQGDGPVLWRLGMVPAADS